MAFDINDPADLLALKNEINNDPLSLGYNPVSGDVTNIINIINTKSYTVSKPKISAADIRSATTYDAYNNLSIDEQEWIRWMTGSNGFDQENVTVTQDLRDRLTDGVNSIWAAGDRTAMNAAMLALIEVSGSRAEVLFGYGTVLNKNDYAAARDS
jgi:hypothetical protein